MADAFAVAALICFAIAFLTSTHLAYGGAKQLIEIMVIFGAGFSIGFAYIMYGVVKGQSSSLTNAISLFP